MKKVWTPEARRAFAEKMRAARRHKKNLKTMGALRRKRPKVSLTKARRALSRASRNWGGLTGVPVHTAKFDRCVRKVKRRSGKRANAYAVCASRLPHGGVRKSHRNPKIRYAVFGRKGNSGPRYRWTGIGFSVTAAPATFATLQNAQAAGQVIWRQFMHQLERGNWRLWAAESDSSAMP
jgi:hypothetical protein